MEERTLQDDCYFEYLAKMGEEYLAAKEEDEDG